MTPVTRRAGRLTVIVGADDRYHHHPLYVEIVRRAHQAGLAGATVFRGIEGYGRASVIHTDRFLDLGDELPVAVVVVDDEQRIRDFLPMLDDVVEEGLALVDTVEVVELTSREER